MSQYVPVDQSVETILPDVHSRLKLVCEMDNDLCQNVFILLKGLLH